MLFVIDNSGSMMEEQQSLGENFAAFLSAALAAGVDYHIGVTTTGLDPSPGGWSECPGGAQGGENGRLFPVDGSRPRIITPQTPERGGRLRHATPTWACATGTSRAWTAPTARSRTRCSTAWMIRARRSADDGNGGFLRGGAKLAIIFMSDEEDFSLAAGVLLRDLLPGAEGQRPQRS